MVRCCRRTAASAVPRRGAVGGAEHTGGAVAPWVWARCRALSGGRHVPCLARAVRETCWRVPPSGGGGWLVPLAAVCPTPTACSCRRAGSARWLWTDGTGNGRLTGPGGPWDAGMGSAREAHGPRRDAAGWSRGVTARSRGAAPVSARRRPKKSLDQRGARRTPIRPSKSGYRTSAEGSAGEI